MRRSKTLIIIAILFLSVGFAAVATNLFINGNILVGTNEEVFDVYFSDAIIDGEQNLTVISSDKKTINFETNPLASIGSKSILEYEITNASTQYDANVSVTCTPNETDLYKVINTQDKEIIEARTTGNGVVTVELKKNVVEEQKINFTCTITASAVERENASIGDISSDNTFVLEGTYVDEAGKVISNANLVVYSDVPHYITTSTTGEILVGNLERGNHEIYHINDTLANIKKMTKEQIKTKALTSAIFTTSDENILFTNNSSISSSIISNKTYCSEIEGKVYEFDYTGGEQELLTICEGTYRLETWGASGGNANATYIGGYGGYSVGNMFLNKETNLYINVGGKGSGGPVSSNWTTYSGGYNGGGTTKWYEVNVNIASGGGATHISDVPGTLDKLESYKGIYSAVDETYLSENIFIVSGGGGGAYWIVNGQNGMGGSGGGHIANPGTSTYNKVIPATGGTQTSGGIRGDWGLNKGLNGLFGKSGDCSLNGGIGGGACAGGGFYGGGTSSWGGAGGGSSYIGNPLLTNKAMYCYDCLESTKEATRTIKVKEFSAKPEANKAKQGNGYAKITYLG